MTKDELMRWALASGWRLIDGSPSLTRASSPNAAIVRLVLKATVASLEIRRPAGKWEKIAAENYSKILADPESGVPDGLGLNTIAGLGNLMQENKDRLVFAKIKAS
jgi:hypothetical protein